MTTDERVGVPIRSFALRLDMDWTDSLYRMIRGQGHITERKSQRRDREFETDPRAVDWEE